MKFDVQHLLGIDACVLTYVRHWLFNWLDSIDSYFCHQVILDISHAAGYGWVVVWLIFTH